RAFAPLPPRRSSDLSFGQQPAQLALEATRRGRRPCGGRFARREPVVGLGAVGCERSTDNCIGYHDRTPRCEAPAAPVTAGAAGAARQPAMAAASSPSAAGSASAAALPPAPSPPPAAASAASVPASSQI